MAVGWQSCTQQGYLDVNARSAVLRGHRPLSNFEATLLRQTCVQDSERRFAANDDSKTERMIGRELTQDVVQQRRLPSTLICNN